jgi:hypothetical protein
MAFVKISELPVLAGTLLPLTAGDVMPIVHGPTTYKVELSTLQNFFTQGVQISAAGQDYFIQYTLNGKLCASPGLKFLQPLSSFVAGDNNVQTGFFGAILGGQNNTNGNDNTFIIGSNIFATVDNYTLVNNISASGLMEAGGGSSRSWNSAYSYTNTQSARLALSALDARYVNASGDSMTGNLSVGADIYANNATFWGDLSVLGNLVTLDTQVTVSSALSVTNFGTSPALTVEQHGTVPIATFRDSEGGYITFADTGSIGVGTQTPNEKLTVVGNISATGSIYGTLTGSFPAVQNILYVSTGGSDNNSGTSIFNPLRTIKKACQIVSQNQKLQFPVTPTIGFPQNQWTIFVITGDYTEINPIYVPAYTSIIGDNLRRVQIRPANLNSDILWLNTACYLWGVTFRDHLYPSAATAFPTLCSTTADYYNAFNYPGYEIANVGTNDYYRTQKPYVITSPYTQGSSSITSSIVAPQQTAITQTFSATNNILLSSNLYNTASAKVNTLFDIFISTILLGSSGANVTTSPKNLSAVPADAGSAITALTGNINTFQNLTTAYVATYYPWALTASPSLSAACYRDTGFIIDAVVKDIKTGTNALIVEYANVYYTGTLNISGATPAAPNSAYSQVWNNLSKFITTYYLSAYPISKSYVTTEFNTLTSILTLGEGYSAINTRDIPTNFDYQASRLLSANKNFFQHELTAYVDKVYSGFAYGQSTAAAVTAAKIKCFRDMGFVIQAIAYDMQNGTNARTITYANMYNLGAVRIPNQEVTTAATIKYGKYLSTFVINNSAVRTTNAGCGIRVDGSLARGFLRSFVTDSYTQTNEGGIGIHIINNGYSQLVSTFTICCEQGIRADTGGNCSINTSNCSFGLSGLVADGYSTVPVLTGTVSQNVIFNTDVITVSGVYPRYDAPDFDKYPVPITVPYVGLVYKISNDPTNTLYILTSATRIDNDGTYTWQIINNDRTNDDFLKGGAVNFYIRSQIATGAHTFEYIGSGTVLRDSIPALGGIANTDNEARAANGGAVFFTSTNHLGNFKVGNDFTIVQETGVIEGRTFQRAILALVTPLTLALE